LGAKDYLLHTLLERPWGPPSLLYNGYWGFPWYGVDCNCYFHSVCPYAWNTSSPSGQIFMKFDNGVFFEDLLKEIEV
jgi:hypothetical protein